MINMFPFWVCLNPPKTLLAKSMMFRHTGRVSTCINHFLPERCLTNSAVQGPSDPCPFRYGSFGTFLETRDVEIHNIHIGWLFDRMSLYIYNRYIYIHIHTIQTYIHTYYVDLIYVYIITYIFIYIYILLYLYIQQMLGTILQSGWFYMRKGSKRQDMGNLN